VAVADDGRIYVADMEAHHVTVLSSDGTGSSSDQSFFFVYSPGTRAVVQDDAQMTVRTVRSGGTIDDTLLTTPPYRMTSKTLDHGGKVFLNVPFTPRPHYALGPTGRVHYAYGDSLTVTAYDATGQPERTVRVPFASTPSVTDDEIADALKDRTRGREQVKSKIPASKPAFDQFFVDADGRYWFGRSTANADSTAWWVAMPSEKRVVTKTLPSTVEILAVKNGQPYGRTKTEAGAPALLRYQIQIPEQKTSLLPVCI